MSVVIYYFMLHLCVSMHMHACNSRHLGTFHKEPGKEFRLTSKTPEIMTRLEGESIKENTIEQKESRLEFLSDEQKMPKASDIKVVQISQEETKFKGRKNHARSTMESKQQDSKEAINNSKDNSITEDVVVMDYAQPHRKPPIHNLVP